VRPASVAQALQVLHAVGDSLTFTVRGVKTESADVQALVRGAMAIAGRVLFSGVPTGVAVTAAQRHSHESTSVGEAALACFMRPVSLQDALVCLTARQGRPL
jgi:NADP-dependent aldehyde dehydrogenase